jgi:hypothetical protein
MNQIHKSRKEKEAMKNREIRTIIGKVESRAEEDGKITLVG